MVQALAFAEIFLGLILVEAGYKGVSVGQVVRGEAGKDVEPAPLGSLLPKTEPGTGSSPGETVPGNSAGENAGGSSLSLYPALAAAKGLLESKLHRPVQVSELGSLYSKYHPEAGAKSGNQPPTHSSIETITGATEP